MKRKSVQAISTTGDFEKGADLSSFEEKVLQDIVSKTGFLPQKNIWHSTYWGKKLGASHWLGNLNNTQTVLKIQGAKPEMSEIVMIKHFASQNRSKLIRPPNIEKYILWDEKNGYEAIFLEYIKGNKVLNEGVLQTRENVVNFFKYYEEYRENCIPKKPWLAKPDRKDLILKSFEKLNTTSYKAYPFHPYRSENDINLIRKAERVLNAFYKTVDLEFVHGHFSFNDLFYEKAKSQKVVLFSNLFWKWRFPYFDAVFAYHWFMYELSRVENITSNQVEDQRKIWLTEIFKVTGAGKSDETIKLVNAALLERAVAGLILDCFLMDSAKPISRYLVDSTRKEIVRLSDYFNG